MIFKPRYIIFFLFLGIHFCFSQNKYVDSLRLSIKQINTPSINKFDAYNKLTEWYRISEDYKMAELTIKKHQAFANNENNNLEEVKALVNLGVLFNNMEEYDKTGPILEQVKNISTSSSNIIITYYLKYLEGYLLYSYHDIEGASELFHELELDLEYSTDYILKAKVFYFLYAVNSNFNNVKNTLLYADKFLEMANLAKDKNLITNAYAALAVAHTLIYDSNKNKLNLDYVFNYSSKSVEIGENYRDEIGNLTFAISKLNLASYYLKYTPNKTKLIIEKVNETLQVAKLAENNPRILANCYGILSQLAQQKQQLSVSEAYLLQAFHLLQNEKPIYYYSIIQICEDLANLYEKKGDYKNAFQYQKYTTNYNLELYNQGQATISKKIEAQYQFEKKEKEVLLLKEISESNQKQKILYASLGILALIGCFFMFRSYHFRLKYSLQKEKKLAFEKHEANLQIKLEIEEQNRLKAEQELLGLKKQKLQDEVMASQLQIQHKNKVLFQLKEKLNDKKNVNINQILREESLIDNDFEKIKFELQDVHPNFFKILSEKAIQKLTILDSKYCAYLYLGMDTKQIANLLNVEAKSVRMTKYRLKQKFGLDSEIDLVQFLKGIK